MRPHRRQPTRPRSPWGSLARTLEWVAISSSHAWKWKVNVKLLSGVRLLATPWIAARQASLSITNSQSSLRFTSIESVMPSSRLILCLLLPPIPPSIRVCSNESTLCMRWPKYWSFSFSISHIQLLATPCTAACQSFLSMEFSSQEYWSGLPFPLPGAFPNLGIEPKSLTSPTVAGSHYRWAIGEAPFPKLAKVCYLALVKTKCMTIKLKTTMSQNFPLGAGFCPTRQIRQTHQKWIISESEILGSKPRHSQKHKEVEPCQPSGSH